MYCWGGLAESGRSWRARREDDMRNGLKRWCLLGGTTAGLALAGAVIASVSSGSISAAAPAANSAATFTKDVAPILQAKCLSCHRPGTVAPMSLLTYQDARPWARSIRERVSRREMPPWHLDKTVGIQ